MAPAAPTPAYFPGMPWYMSGGARLRVLATEARGLPVGPRPPPAYMVRPSARWPTRPRVRLPNFWQYPQDGGDGDEAADPLAMLKADIKTARGKAVMVETTAAGWGEGMASAPRKDWQAQRLGPTPPDAMVQVAKDTYGRMVAACGASPALFDDSDGTSKREALRQWHMGTVMPLARILSHELTMQLDTEVKLVFDAYPLDMASRAASFAKLVSGGMALDKAAAVSGVLAADD